MSKILNFFLSTHGFFKAENAPKPVFNAPTDLLVGWEGDTPFLLDAFGVSISPPSAPRFWTPSSLPLIPMHADLAISVLERIGTTVTWGCDETSCPPISLFLPYTWKSAPLYVVTITFVFFVLISSPYSVDTDATLSSCWRTNGEAAISISQVVDSQWCRSATGHLLISVSHAQSSS